MIFLFCYTYKKSTRRTEREKANDDIGDNIFCSEKKEIEKLMVIKRQFIIQGRNCVIRKKRHHFEKISVFPSIFVEEIY
jgi:hypothetical protein